MKSTNIFILLLIALFTTLARNGAGQELPPMIKTSFVTDSVQKISLADFNGDNLLDLAIISSSSPPVLSIHRNNGDDTFTEIATYPVFEESQLEILDFNLDNSPDIFVIGYASADSVAAVLLSSKGGFEFMEKTLSPDLSKLSSFCWLEYDEHPKPELFVSGISAQTGQPSTVILTNKNDDKYEARESNFSKEIISRIVPVPDPERLYYIQVSGTENPTGLYKLSPQGFKYTALEIPDLENSILAQGDLNHDGAWDLYIYGTNKQGRSVGGIYSRSHGSYEFLPLEVEGSIQFATIQDLNNDGKAELLIKSRQENQSKFYIISEADDYQLNNISLPGDDLFITDYDKDGLPEFLVLSEGELSIYKHDSKEENKFPQAPNMFISLPMEKGLLFSWSSGTDDKTPDESLSYELMLKDNATDALVRSSLINQKTFFDMGYSYGSLGVENIFHYEQPVESSLEVTHTTFDNAHHTGPPSSLSISVYADSVCTTSSCLTTIQKDTLLCEPVAVDLAELFDYQAQYWVSYSEGFIDRLAPQYTLTQSELFYAVNIDGDCIEILYARVRFADEESILSLIESCEGDTLMLSAREGEYTYNWRDGNGEILGSEQLLEYVTTSSETLWVENTPLAGGCSIIDTFQIQVYPYPQLDVMESVSIREGENVQLHAWGAEYYEWSPAENLQNMNSASPVASPKKSTTYYVKAWNEEGCVAYDSIAITIRKDFFIPSLFSPNGDGKNDRLAIIGSGVEQLKLRIYDGKGNMVWEANSPDEAQQGWNGSYNGRPLPPGNYAWELRGMFEDGSSLHFENKSSGFITLIR